MANRRRAQVLPPSNDTPKNSPSFRPTGQVMATTFSGSAGLAAMVFSASFPGRALTSKFGQTGAGNARACAAARPAAAPGPAATWPGAAVAAAAP